MAQAHNPAVTKPQEMCRKEARRAFGRAILDFDDNRKGNLITICQRRHRPERYNF